MVKIIVAVYNKYGDMYVTHPGYGDKHDHNETVVLVDWKSVVSEYNKRGTIEEKTKFWKDLLEGKLEEKVNRG